MLSSDLNKLINFLTFQIGWIIMIYCHDFLSGLIGFGLTIFNYFIIRSTLKEIMLGFFIAFLGILNDFIMVKAGFLSFSNAIIISIPLWLASVWLLFVSTFSSSLGWLTRVNVVFLALMGAVGGSISYCTGKKLNALYFHYDVLPEFLFHALNWFILFPFLFILHNHIRSKFLSE